MFLFIREFSKIAIYTFFVKNDLIVYIGADNFAKTKIWHELISNADAAIHNLDTQTNYAICKLILHIVQFQPF